MNIKSPEVLAPVGNPAMLTAAVRSGADAVYFGSKMFSARRNAENFDDTSLKDAVNYCKLYGVKTYLALNIMIKQSELEDAVETARVAYRAGIDGVIVQDIGLARILHTALPNLQLHASTQMSLHSPAALAFLKECGFTRVVAAREMNEHKLNDFCKVADRLGIEVEVFVHGALCMSVSGQCLLSAILGGRSGNRGLCAGPCRLPFSVKGGTGYDLSLKDLSLFEYINTLKKMGVASLKIEGRMKRPEYVAAAVSACRCAVDNGEVPQKLSSALRGVFSRSGFTDGYFTSKTGREMFGIRTKDDVTASGETFAALHELYRAERQSVAVKISAEILGGRPCKLTISDGVKTVSVSGDVPEIANRRALDKESVIRAIGKLGSTPYFAESIDVILDDGLFLPNSSINELRRSATDALSAERTRKDKTVENHFGYTVDNIAHGGRKIVARFATEQGIPNDLSKVEAVVLPVGCDAFRKLQGRVRLIAELPRWIEDESQLTARLKELKTLGVTDAFCSNLSAVSIAASEGFNIIGGMGLNVANGESAEVLRLMGAKAIVLSPEILLTELKRINTSIAKGLFAYGRLPLMLLKNCPIKNGHSCAQCSRCESITDRMGIEFPIECHTHFCELLNSRPHYLADRLDELDSFDFILLYFTDERQERAAEIIREYTIGAAGDCDYTRGLYYRNLE